ncbi:hypothetical protein RFI_10405, partial [Reticulomyxa filosa]
NQKVLFQMIAFISNLNNWQLRVEETTFLSKKKKKKYVYMEVLGKGSFGKVHGCRSRVDGCLYAVKHISAFRHSNTSRQNMLREGYVMSALSRMGGSAHNLIQYYFMWESTTKDSVYVVMEWCKNGSLASRLGTPQNSSTLKRIALHIGQALHFLHSKAFVHLDVKPENILITDDFQFKLADFGLCVQTHQSFDLTSTIAVGLLQHNTFNPLITPNYQQNEEEEDYKLGLTAQSLDETISFHVKERNDSEDESGTEAFRISSRYNPRKRSKRKSDTPESPILYFKINGVDSPDADDNKINCLENAQNGSCQTVKSFSIQEGDRRYLCRELLEGTTDVSQLHKVDIFALGASIYEMSTMKKIPANGIGWDQIRNGILEFGNVDAQLRQLVGVESDFYLKQTTEPVLVIRMKNNKKLDFFNCEHRQCYMNNLIIDFVKHIEDDRTQESQKKIEYLQHQLNTAHLQLQQFYSTPQQHTKTPPTHCNHMSTSFNSMLQSQMPTAFGHSISLSQRIIKYLLSFHFNLISLLHFIIYVFFFSFFIDVLHCWFGIFGTVSTSLLYGLLLLITVSCIGLSYLMC